MTTLSDLAGDFDAAFADLRGSTSDTETRRSLDAAVSALYKLRGHFEDADPSKYRAVAAKHIEGQMTEGVTLARGKLAHHATKLVEPTTQPLYPGPNTFPGAYTFPGQNLVWREFSELVQAMNGRPVRGHPNQIRDYKARVAGVPVLETLAAAREFLVVICPVELP